MAVRRWILLLYRTLAMGDIPGLKYKVVPKFTLYIPPSASQVVGGGGKGPRMCRRWKQ